MTDFGMNSGDDTSEIRGVVVSRRKAPQGNMFLSVSVSSLESSAEIGTQNVENETLQLVVNRSTKNMRPSSTICCGCALIARCILDVAQNGSKKWGSLSYIVQEYEVEWSPRENIDDKGRWKQHPSVEAKARSGGISDASCPPLCRLRHLLATEDFFSILHFILFVSTIPHRLRTNFTLG